MMNDAAAPGVRQRLPHDTDIERDLLGALLEDNRNLELVETLSPRCFFNTVYARAFDTIKKVVSDGGNIDGQMLRNVFADKRDLEVYNGLMGQSVTEHIADLEGYSCGRDKVASYGKFLQDFAVRRAVIGVCEDLMAAAYDAPMKEDPVTHIENAETSLYNIKTAGTSERPAIMLPEAIDDAVAMISEIQQRGTGLAGLSTGFASLDDLIGGLAPGCVYIIAGRPGMGKTALGVNVLYNIAAAGTPVAMMSLEMQASEIAMRVISGRAGVGLHRLRTGNVHIDQWRRINEVQGEERATLPPLLIDQNGSASIDKLAQKCRRYVSAHKVECILIDYLQLVQGSKKHNGHRVGEMTEITVRLKALAKELNVAIIALSQLSRAVEQRENKRPQLADLRESGSIEQDADCVAFVYREVEYLRRMRPDESDPGFCEWQACVREKENEAEVFTAKNRHGKQGTAFMHFNGETTTFSERSTDDEIHQGSQGNTRPQKNGNHQVTFSRGGE